MTYFATYFYYSKDKEKHEFFKIGEIEWEWLQQGVSKYTKIWIALLLQEIHLIFEIKKCDSIYCIHGDII